MKQNSWICSAYLTKWWHRIVQWSNQTIYKLDGTTERSNIKDNNDILVIVENLIWISLWLFLKNREINFIQVRGFTPVCFWSFDIIGLTLPPCSRGLATSLTQFVSFVDYFHNVKIKKKEKKQVKLHTKHGW